MSNRETGVGEVVPAIELLDNFSAEITTRNTSEIDVAVRYMPKGSELFVAALPGDTDEALVSVCRSVLQAGLKPVPHVVARNLTGQAHLEQLLSDLVTHAQIDRALVLGGDRDKPAGKFDSAAQLLDTNAFRKVGLRKLYFGCYPEGHPRISDAVLEQHLLRKISTARDQGLSVELISQFCFDASPIAALAKKLEKLAPGCLVRAGLAGPAKRTTLVKYAMICGVGASLRALKERKNLSRSMLERETPKQVLETLASQVQPSSRKVSGVHFFTFGSLKETLNWVNAYCSA